MAKRQLYEVFLERMDAAIEARMPFEASWYAFAILEDRLRSMLRNSAGGIPNGILMMGKKIRLLVGRAASDALLRTNFECTELQSWVTSRNDLIHAMADGKSSIEFIDSEAVELARKGANLARVYAAAATRLKKHRGKVTPKP